MTELEKALITIREECNKHSYCSDCPLRMMNNQSDCYVRMHKPENYKLKCDNIEDDRIFAN